MSFVRFSPPEYALLKDRADEKLNLKPAPAADLPAVQSEKKPAEAVPATKS